MDALQKNHPSHLGPNMVSADQVSLSDDNVLYCTVVDGTARLLMQPYVGSLYPVPCAHRLVASTALRSKSVLQGKIMYFAYFGRFLVIC